VLGRTARREKGVRVDYVLKRIGAFLLLVWVAATLNFMLPRTMNTDPIRQRMLSKALQSGYVPEGLDEIVKEYDQKFGLDKPLWQQYVNYLGDLARLDFNYSMGSYPKTVIELMSAALPWTVGLLLVATLAAFVLGTLMGALMGWPKAPRLINDLLFPPLLIFSAVPYYLLGLVLVYFLAFDAHLFPMFGGYSNAAVPDWTSVEFLGDVLSHSLLPAMSIILASIGFWAMGMRGMVVMVQGEDFMTFAEAKGLKSTTVFFRYALRNSMLPQTTALALSLGQILSGAVVVEIVFNYPGIGTLLYQAIKDSDYFVIQGIVLSVIVTIGLATLILDLLYPWLDPRISYERA